MDKNVFTLIFATNTLVDYLQKYSQLQPMILHAFIHLILSNIGDGHMGTLFPYEGV